MKQFFQPLALAGMTAAVLASCQKKVEWSPTYAIPLAEVEMDVGDIVGARPSEVEWVEYTGDPARDSVFTFRLVYFDTLPPITLNQLNSGGAVIPGGLEYTMDEQNVFLRMTGKAESGNFQFRDPEVQFVFENEFAVDFELDLESTYTKNVKTGQESPFTINETASIPARQGTTNGTGTMIVNNGNTGDALTNVFSPAPKFLYYTPKISSPNGGAASSDEDLKVYSKVILPFTGYGQAIRFDTITYNENDSALFNIDNLLGDEELPAGNAEIGLRFAILRMHFENGIPLEASIAGRVVDANYSTLGLLPLYEIDGNARPTTDKIVVPAALQPDITKAGEPSIRTTDFRIYKEDDNTVNPTYASLEDIRDGKHIILEMTFATGGYATSDAVRIFSDQKMKANIGLKTSAGANFERPTLDDLDF